MGGMDSGNSGSIQSSSTGGGGGGGGGGDEQEYDSRGESSSFSSFFNLTNNYSINHFDNARLLQLYSLNNGSSSVSLFDHHQQQQQILSSANFDSVGTANFAAQITSSTKNNSNNLEIGWAPNKLGEIRSLPLDDATCTTPGYNPIITVSTPQPTPLPLQPTANQNQNQNQNPVSGGGSGGCGKNPKKRSRASRRAPTTVLTTDTSNFRQMVQEFTGIPAPPFSGSTFPGPTRLDLFGGPVMGMDMGTGTGMGTRGMGPPSYLRRPFAHKALRPFEQEVRNPGLTTTTLAVATPPSSANANNNNNPILLHQPSSNVEVESSRAETGSAAVGSNKGRGPGGEVHRLPSQVHSVTVKEGGVGNLSNSEGGMMDSWICSSH